MYHLDLATLLHLLAEQTGRVSTTNVFLTGVEAPCEVVVSLLQGQVQDCRIVRGERVLLRGEDALAHNHLVVARNLENISTTYFHYATLTIE